MSLLSRLAVPRADVKLASWARCIAARCRDRVWQRISRRLGEMGPAEAKGYIRARSAAIVHAEVGEFLREGRSIPDRYHSPLVEATIEAVQEAITGLVRERLVAVPVAVPVRRAA